MTFNEIIEHDAFEELLGEFYSRDVGYEFPDDDFGPVKLVSQTFGYMADESQEIQFVLDFDGVLVGVKGYYSSYGGFEENNVFEVKPIEKLVTVYEKIESK